MNPLALLQAKSDEIAALCRRYGVLRLRVFGSAVRGGWDAAKSDFDFLVDLEPNRSLFDLGGLQYDLQELLGRRVDVVDWGAAKKPLFRETAEAHAREIFAA